MKKLLLFEMPNTFVKLKSQKEYDEYNRMREDAGWDGCCYCWRSMKKNNCIYHKIVKESHTYYKPETQAKQIISFPDLKALLGYKPAEKKRAKKKANDQKVTEYELYRGLDKSTGKFRLVRNRNMPGYHPAKYWVTVEGVVVVLHGRNNFRMSTPFRSYAISMSRARQQAKRLAKNLGIEYRG